LFSRVFRFLKHTFNTRSNRKPQILGVEAKKKRGRKNAKKEKKSRRGWEFEGKHHATNSLQAKKKKTTPRNQPKLHKSMDRKKVTIVPQAGSELGTDGIGEEGNVFVSLFLKLRSKRNESSRDVSKTPPKKKEKPNGRVPGRTLRRNVCDHLGPKLEIGKAGKKKKQNPKKGWIPREYGRLGPMAVDLQKIWVGRTNEKRVSLTKKAACHWKLPRHKKKFALGRTENELRKEELNTTVRKDRGILLTVRGLLSRPKGWGRPGAVSTKDQNEVHRRPTDEKIQHHGKKRMGVSG